MTRYTHSQPDAIKPIKNYIKMNTHTKKYTHYQMQRSKSILMQRSKKIIFLPFTRIGWLVPVDLFVKTTQIITTRKPCNVVKKPFFSHF